MSFYEKCGRVGLVLAPLFLVGWANTSAPQPPATIALASASPLESDSQGLSVAGKAELQSIIHAGKLSDLRWPDFSAHQAEVSEFYASLDDHLAWTRAGKPTAEALALIERFQNAQEKGLRPQDYDATRWPERRAQLDAQPRPSDSDLVRFDVALTVSTMRYVSDLRVGRVNPKVFNFGIDIDHKKYDLSQFVREELISAENVNAELDKVEPPYPGYARTLVALHKYLALARDDNGAPLPVPKIAVKPGGSYLRLGALAHKLRQVGDLPAQAPAPLSGESRYEGTLVQAVKHFQARHGLMPNGVLDARTLKELNTPLAHRVLQLELTLERWRWVPESFSRPPLVVNIPEFRLHAFGADNHEVFSMRVVVGKAYDHQTPVFSSAIKSVIFRPYWNVPLSIEQKELVPELRKHPNYLKKNNYEILDSRGNVVPQDVSNPAFLAQLHSGQLLARQLPGPDNSLGLIKFAFPNQFDVYMHGTPATELFSRSRRDFSHGCIRVEHPAELAEWVLRDEPEWTLRRIRAAMKGDETLRVTLAKPIPVLVVYGTAIVTENGQVEFFDDIYGLDEALEGELAKPHP